MAVSKLRCGPLTGKGELANHSTGEENKIEADKNKARLMTSKKLMPEFVRFNLWVSVFLESYFTMKKES